MTLSDCICKVEIMYCNGASNDKVARFLFGPQWAMAATPKDGWRIVGTRWMYCRVVSCEEEAA